MAIKREQITSEYAERSDATQNPSFTNTKDLKEKLEQKTGDQLDVVLGYQQGTEASELPISDFDVSLPRDMTVKLVRADTANWETFISFLFSLTLSFCMLFLGKYISTNKVDSLLTTFETIALWFTVVLTIIFCIIWIVLKAKQQKGEMVVSMEVLKKYAKKKSIKVTKEKED